VAKRAKRPFDEESTTGPLNRYGQTKLEGDRAVIASGCRHFIFRTSWVYSARGRNFMKTMIRLGREKDRLKIVNDQVGAPTPARLIAQVSLLAYIRPIPVGLYHLAPRGETNWRDFAAAIFAGCRERGVNLAVQPEAVRGLTTAEYPSGAVRPLNSRLNSGKLERALNIQLLAWELLLAQTLEEYLDYHDLEA